ncbi:MAG TPA: PadR family transcriptional regulator [Opitutaceae bacterium]|nr:PadR family transcriptional regulator [Opitutaceae bacterium]
MNPPPMAAAKTAPQDPEAELPLSPAVFNILLALADGEKHGYAIMQEVEEATEGRTRLGPGTLYGSLDRMLKAGYITESDRRPAADADDERRRYYRLSSFGRRVLQAEVARLAQAVSHARLKKIFTPT